MPTLEPGTRSFDLASIYAARRVGCSRVVDTPPLLVSLRPPCLGSASPGGPARVLPAQDPKALAVLALFRARLAIPGAWPGYRPSPEPRSPAGPPPAGNPAWPWLGLPRKRWPDHRGFKGSLRRCGRGAPAPGRVPRKPGGVGLGTQPPRLKSPCTPMWAGGETGAWNGALFLAPPNEKDFFSYNPQILPSHPFTSALQMPSRLQ